MKKKNKCDFCGEPSDPTYVCDWGNMCEKHCMSNPYDEAIIKFHVDNYISKYVEEMKWLNDLKKKIGGRKIFLNLKNK